MPTYGYNCPACGHEYEKMQKISDETRAACPKCGTVGERVISGGAGLVFKGSGFYETDYKRAGSPKEKEKDKPDAAAKDSSKSGEKSKKPDSGSAKPKESDA